MADTPSNGIRRSRRIAGQSAGSLEVPSSVAPRRSAAPIAAPAARPRRRQPAIAQGLQSHPPPPSSDFTFTHTQPSVPQPGFGSPRTGNNINSQQNRFSRDDSTPASVNTFVTANENLSISSLKSLARPITPPRLTDTFNAMDIDFPSAAAAQRSLPSRQREGGSPVPTNTNAEDLTAASRLASMSTRPSFDWLDSPLRGESTYAEVLRGSPRPPPNAGHATSHHQHSTGPTGERTFTSPVTAPNREPLTLPLVAAPPVPQPRPMCIACCDEKVLDLIQPCKMCKNHYCISCTKEMFLAAIHDKGRMPPKCCAMIQLHVGLPLLSDAQADEFRSKFEEWLSTERLYCPKMTCSAFIPDRLIEATQPTRPKLFQVLRPSLAKVFAKLEDNNYAKQFQKPIDSKLLKLPSFLQNRTTDMDMPTIRRKLSEYRSISDFMADFETMTHTPYFLTSGAAPLVLAGQHLQSLLHKYLDELRIKSVEKVVTLFACPKCFIAICASCKKIAHPGLPCDHTEEDYETALLQTFGYKRCPKCKAAVKKMYGCSHMQCVCGSHWCYYCQRPVARCDGSCAEYSDEEEGYNEDGGMIEEGEIDEDGADLVPNSGAAEGLASLTTATGPPPRPDGTETRTASTFAAVLARSQTPTGSAAAPFLLDTPTPEQAPRPTAMIESFTAAAGAVAVQPADLDAGGARRWAEAREDFGTEPDDDVHDVWSCHHTFRTVRGNGEDVTIKSDTVLECNRCFCKLKASGQVNMGIYGPIAKPKPKLVSRQLPSSNMTKPPASNMPADTPQPLKVAKLREHEKAFDCTDCNILLCGECKKKVVKRLEERED